jgi:TM2 domain-containing membrane protein YozV
MLLVCLASASIASVGATQQAAAGSGDLADHGTLQRRQQVIGDMIRAGLITSVLQGPPGILRVSVGDRYASSPSKEFYFSKLANAYFAWAPSGSPVVVELYNQRGEKFGEYADGLFGIGPTFSSPIECRAGEVGCPISTARVAPATAPPVSAQASVPTPVAVRPEPQGSSSGGPRVDTIYVKRDQAQSGVVKATVAELRPGDAGYKDGGTATLLSFLIAGAGQIYTGDTGTGLLYFLGSSTAIGVGIAATDWDCYDCDYGPAIAGLAVGTAIWIGSMIDAGPSARRQNRKLAAERQSAMAPILEGGPAGARLGLRLAIRP